MRRRLSQFTYERTKPLFPSVASSVKSTVDVASKGYRTSPAPASNLFCFSVPSFCRCVCASWRYLLFCECPVAPEQALCCCMRALGFTLVRNWQWDSHTCMALPPDGTPCFFWGLGWRKEAPSTYPHSFRVSLGIYRGESTVPYGENPCSPETKPF